MRNEQRSFEAILRVLCEHKVDYILVGGLCAVMHGAPIQTSDIDIVQSRDPENLVRLEAALRELGASYREHRNRIGPEARKLASPGHHLLSTKFGPIDVLGTIASGRDYESLLSDTVGVALDDDSTFRMLTLPTLILTKQETNREKDRLVLPILIITLKNSERLPD